MERDEAVRRLRQHTDDLAGFGIRSLALFGSTARGSASKDSDVDVLVEFESPPGLRQFMALKFQLEEWLNSEVDLIDRSALRDRWRPGIERDAILAVESLRTSLP